MVPFWYDVLGNSIDPPPLMQCVGIVVSITSLLFSVLRFPLQAIVATIPFMAVMVGFVAFVIWNGGIVLGMPQHPITYYYGY